MTIAGVIKKRDSFLDIAKGLAIILVVIGHVIQGSSEHFDDLMGFKMIYSFHMPLFIFLSGAVAAISFDAKVATRGLRPAVLMAWGKIQKAFFRLLIPFIAWCVLNQLIFHHANSVWSALGLAFRRPDTALWFLLAIFYCVALTGLFQILFALILWALEYFRMRRDRVCRLFSGPIFQVALMILIWWSIKDHTPYGAGLALLKPYFIYYALGLGFYKFTQGQFPIGYSILGGVVFFMLVPFWARTAQFQYVGPIVLPDTGLYFYAGILAISGIWIFLGCAKMITLSKVGFLKNFLILCGQLSLGIYAIHYFFLAYSPKILVPLCVSLLISYLLNKIPVIRTLFLGER